MQNNNLALKGYSGFKYCGFLLAHMGMEEGCKGKVHKMNGIESSMSRALGSK